MNNRQKIFNDPVYGFVSVPHGILLKLIDPLCLLGQGARKILEGRLALEVFRIGLYCVRIADCFGAIDYFERRRTPYVIALNRFDGVLAHPVEEVREALAVAPEVPVVVLDARDRESTRSALIALTRHAIARKSGR